MNVNAVTGQYRGGEEEEEEELLPNMSLSSVFQEPRHTSVTLSGMWWRVEPAQIQFTHLFL